MTVIQLTFLDSSRPSHTFTHHPQLGMWSPAIRFRSLGQGVHVGSSFHPKPAARLQALPHEAEDKGTAESTCQAPGYRAKGRSTDLKELVSETRSSYPTRLMNIEGSGFESYQARVGCAFRAPWCARLCPPGLLGSKNKTSFLRR